ncbi:nitrate- and nitrite sensing domain-containing protein [Streptomyces sp. NPDC001068]|uniref:sensor histidine kinase n=1 Tax=Streptomyces sp. NPDC001068 TaxID=3364544 RepID=UPI00369E6FFB
MRTSRRTPAAGPQTPAPRPPRGRRAHAGAPADEPVDVVGAAAGDRRATGRRLRPRTVRAKVVCLLMVPVVSLLALWAYATVTTAQDVSRLRQSQRVDAALRTPVAGAVTALQAERTAAVRYTADPTAERAGDLRRAGARTDRAVAGLRLGKDSTVADSGELPSGVAERLRTFVTGAGQLRTLRSAVGDRSAGRDEAYTRYTQTIATAFAVDGALTGVQADDMGADARVLLEFSRAGEALAQEDAVLAGARRSGGLAGARLSLFTGAVNTRRVLTDAAVADLPAAQRTAWHRLTAGRDYAALSAAEDGILGGRPGAGALAAAPEGTWDTAHARVQDGMRSIQTGTARAVAGRADPFARGLLTPAGAAVLFGLLAVAASLVISVRIGRGLVVELVSLRNRALEIARRKLPEAMGRLRAGEEIDVRAEAPLGPPAEDETGQVAEALGTVHRAALRAAVERAELASGISGVFVNLARRSQVLVHRQLSLLDSMERRSDNPDELSDLFRLDHLTTRMRRHAESLIILSGAAPGRAWRTPVSLTDVVRAAVSEVEDYARVEIRRFPEAAVTGTAVADLTHLLAEVVENAAQFSPPHTRVRVCGEPVGNGYVLEVEDRGLGMGEETLAEANRRIEQSEALDLFDSDRLGLFVVSRLAARHGIRVHLRTSPYGGTTAVVLLPKALLHGSAVERSAGPAAGIGREPDREHARVPGTVLPQAAAPVAPAVRPVLAATHAPPAAAAHAPRPTAQPAPEPPPPGVTTLRPHRPPHDSESRDDDLPRRVRQAHLAPQLRDPRSDEPTPARRGEERTPELVRDRMTAYRDGWARGGGRRPGRTTTPEPEVGADSTEGDHA